MQSLFSEFPKTRYADWEKQVIKDLKGESPGHLFWENENGFSLKPYISREEISTEYGPAFLHKDWKVCVQQESKAEEMNKNFLRDLKHGAEAIAFELKTPTVDVVLHTIQLDLISVNIGLKPKQAPALKKYLDENYKNKVLNISLLPVSLNEEEELNSWNTLQDLFKEYSGVKTTSVNAVEFTAKNALPYYELALVFTQLIETLSRSESTQMVKDIVIKTSCDGDFFVQMAKLRAYRRLWKLIAKEYQIGVQLYIIAETDLNSLSVSDVYTNLLRNTLSAMSAILGGCNELIVQPYDCMLADDYEFSSRLAMNQQFILKHEAYLDQMGDVACGAYYIEHLTDALCEKAFTSIKEIEARGGYFNCRASGEIKAELEKQNKAKLENLSSGKTKRVGVNIFRNEKEKLDFTSGQMSLFKTLAPHHPLLNYELLQSLKA